MIMSFFSPFKEDIGVDYFFFVQRIVVMMRNKKCRSNDELWLVFWLNCVPDINAGPARSETKEIELMKLKKGNVRKSIQFVR